MDTKLEIKYLEQRKHRQMKMMSEMYDLFRKTLTYIAFLLVYVCTYISASLDLTRPGF